MDEFREIKSVIQGLIMGAPWKAAFAVAAGAFHWVFGVEYTPLIVMLLLMLIDLVTGVWRACAVRDLSSRGIRRGAMKFFVYAVLMAATALTDKVIPVRVAFSTMTAYLAMTELISIMENFAALGWPVPMALIKTLKVMQDKRAASEVGR